MQPLAPDRSLLIWGLIALVAAAILIWLGIVWHNPGVFIPSAFAFLVAVAFLSDQAIRIHKYRENRVRVAEERFDLAEGKLGTMHQRLEGLEDRLAEEQKEIRRLRTTLEKHGLR